MTTPTTQALRESVEKAIAYHCTCFTVRGQHSLADRILSAIQPLLAPAASEREKALEDALRPFAKLAARVDLFCLEQGSTCEWRMGADDIRRARDLLAQIAPTVSDDTRRLDWLEKQYANIYVHKVEGSNDSKSPTYCWCGPKIRQAIDSAMTGANGGGK